MMLSEQTLLGDPAFLTLSGAFHRSSCLFKQKSKFPVSLTPHSSNNHHPALPRHGFNSSGAHRCNHRQRPTVQSPLLFSHCKAMATTEPTTRPQYHPVLIRRQNESLVHRHPTGLGWDLILRSPRRNPGYRLLGRACTFQPYAGDPQFVNHIVDSRSRDP
jgi:hypothetical protein